MKSRPTLPKVIERLGYSSHDLHKMGNNASNALPSVVPLQTLFSLLYSQAEGRAGDTINTNTSITRTQINVMQGTRN